jgi:pyroglutamyl-peptidase
MKKLLITGFEPFGGETMNPSWEAVNSLPKETGGYEIIKLKLPVAFGRAGEMAIDAAKELHPDVILCIGQAGGREVITPELVGINLRHADIPDNAGRMPKDEPVIEGGAAAHFSTLPVRRMAEAIKDSGLPARVSYSAGAYVCNDLLYTLLSHFDGSKTRVGFIHIPYAPEQGKEPSLEISKATKGLIIAIENMD